MSASSSLDISTPSMKQDISGMGLFDLVIRDHRVVNELVDSYQKNNNQEEKQLIAYHIVRELSMHSAAEEMTWYLMLESKLGAKGKKYFDESVQEHQQLKEDLEVLNTKSFTDAEFQAKFPAVVKDVMEHVQFEETTVIPDLRAACTQEELMKMKEEWNASKAMAPTRPHPSAGTPAGKLAAKATAVLDKTADLSRFGMEKGKDYHAEPSAGVTTRSGATTGGAM